MDPTRRPVWGALGLALVVGLASPAHATPPNDDATSPGTLRPAHPARARQVEAQRAAVREQAAREWRTLLGRLAAPDPGLEAALGAFVDRFDDALVEVDGFAWPVLVPEVDEARRALHVLLEGGGRPVGGAVALAVRAVPLDDVVAWEDGVRAVLVGAYDRDGNGRIDRRTELDALPCEDWQALDGALRRRFEGGIVAAYGFARGAVFHGDRLGFDRDLADRAVGAARVCGVGGTADDPDPLLATLRSLPDAGSTAWDLAVREALVRVHDADASGRIDEAEELAAVSCDAWAVLDHALRGRWEAGIRELYGFDRAVAGGSFLGAVLGLDPALATAADARVATCLGERPPEPAPEPGPRVRPPSPSTPASAPPPDAPPAPVAERAPADAPTPPAPEATLTERIRAVPEGGTTAWDAHVKTLMLDGFDADGDGWIGSDAEVQAIPCSVWVAVDQGVRERWQRGFWGTYGVEPGGTWLGFLLGLRPDVRPTTQERLRGCGLDEGRQTRVPVGPEVALDADAALQQVRSLRDGGSDTWDLQVTAILLGAFDDDRSGGLDAAEVVGIPCALWAAVDDGVRDGWHRGLAHVYGIAPDRPWAGDALGFDLAARDALVDRLTRCGRGPGDDPEGALTPASLADAIRGVPDGGSNDWDHRVARLLLAVHDHDGSGTLDRPAEVDDVPCATWGALDDGVRGGWDASLYVVYGFAPELDWVGHALGIDAGQRPRAAARLEQCGLSTPVRAASRPEDVALHLRALPPLAEDGVLATQHKLLVRAFDTDGTGRIDQVDEVRAVDCEVWSLLDARAREASGEDLVGAFHLDDADGWRGEALGLDPVVGPVVLDALASCRREGVAPVEPEPAEAVDPATSVGALRRAWIAEHDGDGDGRLDTSREVRGVSCEQWRTLDEIARAVWGAPAREALGLDPGAVWHGDEVALSASVRGVARRQLLRCLTP